MRNKDTLKKESLCKATVELVNEIGFSATSISKIAKVARVSPATTYTYFENKDDLLVTTYLEIMERMSGAIFARVDQALPVRDILHTIWRDTFEYVQGNQGDFLYTEQFSKTPYVRHLKLEDHKRFFAPLVQTIRRGIAEKVLKDVHFHMHATFFLYPVFTLANPGGGCVVAVEDKTVETAFELAWDAIRL